MTGIVAHNLHTKFQTICLLFKESPRRNICVAGTGDVYTSTEPNFAFFVTTAALSIRLVKVAKLMDYACVNWDYALVQPIFQPSRSGSPVHYTQIRIALATSEIMVQTARSIQLLDFGGWLKSP
ncbi:MAG: hypothetical protein Q9173_003426 [Seirophora scorigena]